MYRYAAVLLAVAAIVNAQSLPNVPSCSLQCFTTALTTDGCASLTDFACHCAKPQLVSQIQPCVAQACSQADQAGVNSVVQQTCQQAGVPINLPGSGSSSSAPPSSSTPASSSAPASSPAPASSSAADSYYSSASPSVPASPSSAAGGCSTGCTLATSSSALASAMGSPSTTTTTASSGVAAATTGITGANATSSITPYTGGAASSQVKGAFGGVAVVVAALAFAF